MTSHMPPALGADTRQLGSAARRALAHISARTITGRFASRLYDMPADVWDSALDELRRAGHGIEWTFGQVADDPTVTGRYVLVPHDNMSSASVSSASVAERPAPDRRTATHPRDSSIRSSLSPRGHVVRAPRRVRPASPTRI
jgi:hypothetical protein